jgi:hypothetical protein
MVRTVTGIDMKYEKPDYEFPVHDVRRAGAIGQPAGIYWFEGQSTIVAYDSAAEQRLIDQGAVLVATLRFDPDPLERSHVGRDVRRLNDAAALRQFAGLDPAPGGRSERR